MHCEARGVRFDVLLDGSLPSRVVKVLRDLTVHTVAAPHEKVTRMVIRQDAEFPQRWNLFIDEMLHFSSELVSELLSGLLHFVTLRVIAGRDDVLSVHAAAVVREEAGVLVPAASGRGKTTLCARLLEQQFAYLTDESVGVKRSGGLEGYAKPLGIKSGAKEAFADHDLDTWSFHDAGQSVWHLPASEFGSVTRSEARGRCIIFPAYEADATLRLERVSAAQALLGILESAQNLHLIGPARALEIAGDLVARCNRYSVVHGDARTAAARLVEVILDAPPPPTSFSVATGRTSRRGPLRALADDTFAACFDDSVLFYDACAGRLLASDETATGVLALLDGTRDDEQICAEIAERSGADYAAVRRDLPPWMDTLEREGLLTSGR